MKLSSPIYSKLSGISILLSDDVWAKAKPSIRLTPLGILTYCNFWAPAKKLIEISPENVIGNLNVFKELHE